MTQQKGKILTFCFSLIPGAGQMYLGFMKQGISLMTLFAAFCAAAFWMQFGAVLLFAPVIWFYSFFDAINKNSLDPSEFYALEDHYIWGDGFLELGQSLPGSGKKAAAVLLLVVAACMIWSTVRSVLCLIFGDYSFLVVLFERVPVLVGAAVILWFAVKLLQSAREEMEDPFFAEERTGTMPYPVVHPPVFHGDEAPAGPDGKQKSGPAQDAEKQPEEKKEEAFSVEDFCKPEKP